MTDTAHILVVDDEPIITCFLEQLFADCLYNVESVNSGHAAMARLQNRSYDVLITDLSMPDMSGIELVFEARKMHPQIHCIIISGQDEETIARRTAALGKIDFFSKPLDFGKLEQAVQRALGQET